MSHANGNVKRLYYYGWIALRFGTALHGAQPGEEF